MVDKKEGVAHLHAAYLCPLVLIMSNPEYMTSVLLWIVAVPSLPNDCRSDINQPMMGSFGCMVT